jgi:UDP-2,4-diacetamido-2,4,6-trideoxy-beta-L-altropyranose hydrolase
VKIVIRADGGGSVGWGHLSRCAALAEVLVQGGVQVHWACRAASAVELVTGAPPALTLPGPPTVEDLPSEEAAAVSAFASDADWIVVDHYGADATYIETLRLQSDARVLLFEDHQVRRGADLRLAPTQEESPGTLAGALYQVIRPCFTRTHPGAERRGWLLALGGADPGDHTSTCAAELQGGPPLTVLASDAIAKRQSLDQVLTTPTQRVAWMSPDALARALVSCEAALVSSSTLSWEALATGTPIVALRTADNQVGVAATLREAGISVLTDASEAARALKSGHARLPSPNAQLDGLGAWRVAQALGVQVELPSRPDAR